MNDDLGFFARFLLGIGLLVVVVGAIFLSMQSGEFLDPARTVGLWLMILGAAVVIAGGIVLAISIRNERRTMIVRGNRGPVIHNLTDGTIEPFTGTFDEKGGGDG